jgi:hypothetical protein
VHRAVLLHGAGELRLWKHAVHHWDEAGGVVRAWPGRVRYRPGDAGLFHRRHVAPVVRAGVFGRAAHVSQFNAGTVDSWEAEWGAPLGELRICEAAGYREAAARGLADLIGS